MNKDGREPGEMDRKELEEEIRKLREQVEGLKSQLSYVIGLLTSEPVEEEDQAIGMEGDLDDLPRGKYSM